MYYNIISQTIDILKKLNKKIVFTNGCFDLFHVGHLKLLKESKKYGDILIVGINSDKSVKNIKSNNRPIINENQRLATISAIMYVDIVYLFDEDTPIKLIEIIKPDVLVKGSDWNNSNNISGYNFIKSYGGDIKFVELLDGISTTNIIMKIKQKENSL